MFWCKWGVVTGKWIYNEELHFLYSSPIFIRMIMSRGRVMVENVACGAYGGEVRCIEDFGGET
jgi:hypothetical protein